MSTRALFRSVVAPVRFKAPFCSTARTQAATRRLPNGNVHPRLSSSSASISSSSSSTLLIASLASVLSLGAGYLLFSSSTRSSSVSAAQHDGRPKSSPTTSKTPGYDYDAAVSELRKSFPASAFSNDETELDLHTHSSWSYHPSSHPHSLIIYPTSTDDVVKLVQIASRYKVPLVPFAGGTSLEAHFSAPSRESDGRQSICVDVNRMNRIVRISEEDGDVTVEPGVRWEDLNRQLAAKGSRFFFPIDPGPTAAIGGMVACGCSGTNAVRYGTMKGDHVLNLTVVLPSGEVITTRSRARKSSVGPDLTKLFLGSEGTLGIVVSATLRLAPVLAHQSVGVSSFPSAHAACAAASDLLMHGVGVQCVELLDDVMIRCVNKANENDPKAILHDVKDSLFIKFAGGSEKHIDADAQLATVILQKHGGSEMKFSKEREEIERLWHARKVALWSAIDYQTEMSVADTDSEVGQKTSTKEEEEEEEEERPFRCWTTDVCVPLGQLSELIKRVKADVQRTGVFAPLVGHVGDGNTHFLLIHRDGDTVELEKIHGVVERMVHEAQNLGGTATGEHGVGVGKKAYLKRELGEGTVELLKMLKRTVSVGAFVHR